MTLPKTIDKKRPLRMFIRNKWLMFIHTCSRPAVQFSLGALLGLVAVIAFMSLLMQTFGTGVALPFVVAFALIVLLTLIGRWLASRAEPNSKTDSASPMKLETFKTRPQAAVLVARLKEHQIRATAVGGYASGLPRKTTGKVHVIVGQAEYERASQLVERWNRGEPEFSDHSSTGDIVDEIGVLDE